MDAAASRLMIIVHSDPINELASEMRQALNKFLRVRAREGKGNVPNDVIKQLQLNEQRFAQLVVKELVGVDMKITPDRYV